MKAALYLKNNCTEENKRAPYLYWTGQFILCLQGSEAGELAARTAIRLSPTLEGFGILQQVNCHP